MAISGVQDSDVIRSAVLPWIGQQAFLEKLNHVFGAFARKCRQLPANNEAHYVIGVKRRLRSVSVPDQEMPAQKPRDQPPGGDTPREDESVWDFKASHYVTAAL